MVKNEHVATQINELMLEFAKQLDQSLMTVMETCSEEEFGEYRHAIGTILADIIETLNPIYKMHPKLKPPELE